ncbi:MAG: TetR/AcrR family transcriptional regulator [Phycisphaerae bacterium]|nr:TetR/AcrR family transcriptional regulator [Phycisphaerae bacterium]
MRVTAQTKLDTDAAIRAAATRLFAKKGVEATSTRDIASAAKIAVGTLFNYYGSKESLALSLVAEAMEVARGPNEVSAGRTAEEDLFALMAKVLRALAPMRAHLVEILESGLSPLASASLLPEAARIREIHLADVVAILHSHTFDAAVNSATLHLYWALFLAVLSYWATDASPSQEDTRALIDQTVRMFVSSLRAPDQRTAKQVPSM